MKTNLYLKTVWRDIRDSFGRFAAIVIIIFMSVLLFVGIKSIGPDLNRTADQLIKTQKVSDLQVVSTGGLTENDLEAVTAVAGVTAELGQRLPIHEEKQQLNLQVYSYAGTDGQNHPIITKGRLPKAADEILIDRVLADRYPLETTITLEDEQLKNTTFTVVGFADSPIYVDDRERGVTNIGDGQVSGFAYVPQAAFKNENYSILYVSFNELAKLAPTSETYKEDLAKEEAKVEQALAARKAPRLKEIKTLAEKKLAPEAKKLTEAQQKLQDGQAQLDQAKAETAAARQQLEAAKTQLQAAEAIGQGNPAAEQQLAGTEKNLSAAEAQLKEKQQELDDNQEEIKKGQQELDQAKQEIDELKEPNYLLTERQDNPGFNEFQSLAVRIDAIANVFPVFFFLIAILIIFTSMTRMIEENRREIGTLKALGYRNGEIASKYLLYAFAATVIGVVLGIVAGKNLLPRIVFDMLSDQYIYQSYANEYFVLPILIAVAAAAFSTLVSSAVVLIKDLREKTTTLLNARAPRSGQRVLLEKVKPIWNRLNFNQKVAYRNIFRYKARGLLTVCGIAGCAGLMVAGFGLRDSIPAPTAIQFSQLVHYDGVVSLDEDLNHDETDSVAQLLTQQSEITETFRFETQQVTFKKTGVTKQSATLNVINPSEKQLTDFVTLQSGKNQPLKLTDTGALVSRQLAKLFDVEKGDTLRMTNAAGENYSLKVAGIFENYLGHSLYLTPTYYQQVTGETSQDNAYWITTKDLSSKKRQALAKTLYKSEDILNVTYMADQLKKQDSMTESIGPIVFIFILLSAVLAFVVLYNLTNINISERQREMATIKVLGFYDGEVTMYLLRETVVFTVIGILLGFGVGRLLTWFILTMASSDTIVFPMVIHWQGYAVSAALTILFTGIVTVVTHFKLKHIHMIEALKSNE